MKYWLIQLAIFIILLVDFLFVLDKGYTLLAILIALVLIVLVVMTINSFLILSTFEFSLINLYIFSFLMVFYILILTIKIFYFLVKNNQQTLVAFQKKYSTTDEDER